MFAKWFEEYKKLFQKTRFISQMAAFLISVFTILSLYDIAHFFYFNPSYSDRFFEIHLLFPSVIFQSVIFIIFVSRFGLSFLKSKKAFIFNQILWIIGFSLLLFYWYISRPTQEMFRIYSTFGDSIFKHASRSFDGLGMWYLILSPLRQITTIIIAWIKSK